LQRGSNMQDQNQSTVSPLRAGQWFLPPPTLLSPAGAQWPRPKTNKKQKNHAASTTSNSTRGPGDGVKLERPLRAKQHTHSLSLSLSLSLSPSAGRGLFGAGAGAQWPSKTKKKRPQNNKKPRREHHLRQRACPWGRSAARAPTASQILFCPLPHALSLALWSHMARAKNYPKIK
jgi:hypothetical protein